MIENILYNILHNNLYRQAMLFTILYWFPWFLLQLQLQLTDQLYQFYCYNLWSIMACFFVTKTMLQILTVVTKIHNLTDLFMLQLGK